MFCLVVGAVHAAGCVGAQDKLSESESALGLADRCTQSTALESGAGVISSEPGASCNNRFVLPIDGADLVLGSKIQPKAAAASCPVDIYFHPNNGAHGGWIESWRLCDQGGGNFQICTGGSAPVRFWNPSSCGGTVLDFYPQGWHGTAQTFGGCC